MLHAPVFKLIAGLVILTMPCFGAWAADHRPQDTDVVVVNWVDNFTYGAFNTALGIPLALVGMGYQAAVHGHKPSFRLDRTRQQLVIEGAGFGTYFDFSTGGIHHSVDRSELFKDGPLQDANGKVLQDNAVLDPHEAGHAKQAAILGPAYLPIVGITYLVQGLDEGVIEGWADSWDDLSGSMKTKWPLRLTLQNRDTNGHKTAEVGISTALAEKLSHLKVPFNGNDNPTQVVYRYGQMGAYRNIAGESGNCVVAPLRLEGTLFSKDFLAQWGTVEKSLHAIVDSKQETGKVSADLARGRVDSSLLSHQLGLGLRIGNKDRLAVDVIGRGTAGLKGIWFPWSKAGEMDSPGLIPTVGYGGEVRAHVSDQLEAYVRRDVEVGTKGYHKTTDTIGAETPLYFKYDQFTDKKANQQPVQYYLGAEHRDEKESVSDSAGNQQNNRIKTTLFSVGGRW